MTRAAVGAAVGAGGGPAPGTTRELPRISAQRYDEASQDERLASVLRTVVGWSG